MSRPLLASFFADRGPSAQAERYHWRLLLLTVFAVILLPGCAGGHHGRAKTAAGDTGTLTVQGSDTMEKMVTAWSQSYMKEHPQLHVVVRSGDTGIGIKDLIDGKIDLAAASRELTDDENNTAHSKGVHLSRTMVAKDSVAIVVGPTNQVTALTMDELKGIFSGGVKEWSQIKSYAGGVNGGMLVLGREASSGTGDYLREHVLGGKPYGDTVKLLPSSQSVIDTVEKQKQAIGFVGMSQAELAGKRIKVVPIKLNDSSSSAATDSSLTGSNYPLERPLYLYTDVAGNDLTKSFVDFCRSEGGQKIVTDMGFLSVR